MENMTLNRSRSESNVSFESSYADIKIDSSQMKHHILQSYDEEQAYMSQIISVVQDGQKLDKLPVQELYGRNDPLNGANNYLDEIQSVKADVDGIDKQPQLLKIKISLQDQILVSTNQQQMKSKRNLQGNQTDFTSPEIDEIKSVKLMKIQSNLEQPNQNLELTKNTADIQQLQSLEQTAISSQVHQQMLNNETKKKKREKKDKKEKKEKRKYTKRKSPQEKKPKSQEVKIPKEAYQAQIQMIQELIEQNLSDEKICTHTILQDDKQNQIIPQPSEIKNLQSQLTSKLVQQITQLPSDDTNKAQQKKNQSKTTKIQGKKIKKPKSNKNKSQDKIIVQQLPQHKQNIQPTPSISPSKPLVQNIYKCDIDNCIRTFLTKQGLSLHKTRYHKLKSKSQLSIKKAEHQSCKQIYKQIYPEDTRCNPIKLAELKQGMKIQQ